MTQKLFVRRYGIEGLALQALSVLIWSGSWLLVLWTGGNVVAWGLAIGSVFAVYWLLSLARRTRQKIFLSTEAVERYVTERKQPLFVFLREFTSDSLREVREFVTQEEVLADKLSDWSTVLAVGKPGERLPAAGSFRIYLDGTTWQANVSRLIDRADLIVMRLGTTPSLGWELGQLIGHDKLSRTLFMRSPDSQRNIDSVFQLQQRLPNSTSGLSSEHAFEGMDKDLVRKLQILESFAAVSREVGAVALALDTPPLVRFKNGELVGIHGPLQQALTVTMAEMGFKATIRPKLRAAAALAFFVFLALPQALPTGIDFLCAGDATPICSLIEQHGVLAFMALGLLAVYLLLFLTY